MESKKYVCGIVSISSIFITLIVCFNWLVDPYGVWQDRRIRGLNDYMQLSGHERAYKMINIARNKKIETIFLGSSCVYKALYPQAWNRFTDHEVYNAGFNGARVLEIKRMLEQAIEFHPELSEVVLGLNWYMFDKRYEGMEKEFPVVQVGWRFPVGERFWSTLVSMDAFKASVQTIRLTRKEEYISVIDADGKMNVAFLRNEYARSEDLDTFAMDTIGQIPMFKNYDLSEESMNEYASIIAVCEAAGINLKVYINPVHSIFLESIYAANGGRAFEEWKKQLAKLHPIYDFAYYSRIGNEPFSLHRVYWRNTQHEMPITGDLILARLAGQELPNDIGEFGFLLTADNVECVLERERGLRSCWKNENPDIVLYVEEIVQRN